MLISRRLVVTVALICATMLGCRGPSAVTQNKAPATGSHPAPIAADAKPAHPQSATPQPVITDPVPTPGTAEALAQRAATYAQTVAPLVSARQPAEPPQPPEQAPQTVARKSAPHEAAPALPPKTEDARAFGAVVPSKPDVQVTRQAPPAPAADVAVVPAPAPSVRPPATDMILAALARRAADYPQDLAAQADNQLGRLLKDEPVPDLQSLAALAPEDREVLGALMDALSNFRNQLRQDNNMLFSKKIAPLVELSDRLRSQAELAIPTFILVKDAQTFGVYEKLDPARFVAGKAHSVAFYYEVENFSSQLNDRKMYETKLTQNMVLYTESSGLPVWTDQKINLHDLSHRRRHDFSYARRINLPANLTIGRYLLKVSIEDQQARRIAENTVPLEIVAQ